MKVIELYTKNIKKIKAVNIKPGDGNMVVVTGGNGAGKTSVLDSIYYALKKDLPEQVIRQGERVAETFVDLGEYRIKRTFRVGGKDTLEVLSRDGHAVRKPQTVLNELVGQLSFDPLEFSHLGDKKQKDVLLKLLKIDFFQLDKTRKDLYDDRTVCGREASKLETSFSIYTGRDFKNVPDTEIDVGELTEAIELINNDLKKINTQKAGFDTLVKMEEAAIARIADLEMDLKLEKESLAELQANKEKLSLDVEIGIERKKQLKNERSDKTSRIHAAAEENALVHEKRKCGEILKRTAENKTEYDALTRDIEAIDEEKARLIREAKMPIEGLSFDETGLLYNNVPFAQLCSAEQLKVSVAIAMAMNPTLRVIHIADGSLLDDKSLAVIEEMATDKDFQVWVEKVDSSGEVGIYIEDGEIARNNLVNMERVG